MMPPKPNQKPQLVDEELAFAERTKESASFYFIYVSSVYSLSLTFSFFSAALYIFSAALY